MLISYVSKKSNGKDRR
uniref:Uncharacterized protein n=1 Tax=Arundo donax TaxID=35708 RepID=A0A0A9BL65_ARUDO